MLGLIKKIVGTKNDREVKRIGPYVGEINELEAEFQRLGDAELRDKTEHFKKRVHEATDPLRNTLEEVQREALTADTEDIVGEARRAGANIVGRKPTDVRRVALFIQELYQAH